jgi:hypothetical protein
MSYPRHTTLLNSNFLQPNGERDSVRAVCGRARGVSQLEFRTRKFRAQSWTQKKSLFRRTTSSVTTIVGTFKRMVLSQVNEERMALLMWAHE